MFVKLDDGSYLNVDNIVGLAVVAAVKAVKGTKTTQGVKAQPGYHIALVGVHRFKLTKGDLAKIKKELKLK